MFEFIKNKSITQVKIFDLLDKGDLYKYNQLLRDPNVTVIDESPDKSIPGIPGMTEATAVDPKLIRVVSYLIPSDKI